VIGSSNSDPSNTLFHISLVKLFEKFLPSMLDRFENFDLEIFNFCYFHKPNSSVETMKHEMFTTYYSSKL